MFTFNLLRLRAKDWSKLETSDYSHAEKATTLEQFSDMFRTEYVPLVDMERSTQEYLSLKQAIDSVTKITKMFT